MRRWILIPIGILCFSSLCMAGEEVWTQVKSPHFVVVSNGSVKQAKRTAKLFEQYRLLVQNVMIDSKVDPAVPLTVFAAKDEKSFKTLLAEEQQEKGAAKRTGWFIPGQERELVVVRIDTPIDETYRVIFHEYVHLITRLNYGNLPLWLSEGLAEFFAYSELSDNLTYLGKVKPEVIENLKTKPLIPLSTLLSVKRDSPYYREADKVSVFYPQSWALAHYLIIGDNRAHSKQLMGYIGLIRNGVSEQDAATQAFGDLKSLEKGLANYINLPTTAYFEVPAKLEVEEDRYEAKSLSISESLALRGELLVFRNHPDRARALLDQALALDPKNARANEAMGQLSLMLKNQEQAKKYFAAAADLSSTSYMANFYAAQAMNSQSGDSEKAEKYLRKAIDINPGFAPAYMHLSNLLRGKSNFVEALALAKKGESLQPGILAHKINIAGILVSMDQMDEAYEYGRRVSALARDESEMKQAESLMSFIARVREQKVQIKRFQEEANERRKREREEREKLTPDEELPDMNTSDSPIQSAEMDEKIRREEIAGLASMKPGIAVRIEGIVKSVKCDSPAIMELTLEATGQSKIFVTDNYLEVALRAIGSSAKKNIQPCSDLEGKRVVVEYLMRPSKYFSGIIKSVIVGIK